MWVLKSRKEIIWGRNITRIRKTLTPQCFSFLFRPIIYVCTNKLKKASMVEPFSWLWRLDVKPLFIAIMTAKIVWPLKSLKIGWFGPGFQWPKSRSYFWKKMYAYLTNLYCPIFNWGVSHFEKWNILEFNYFYSVFDRWNCKSLKILWRQKDLRTKYRKLHRNWTFRSWEIWIYSWVMRFFITFFQPNKGFCKTSFVTTATTAFAKSWLQWMIADLKKNYFVIQ